MTIIIENSTRLKARRIYEMEIIAYALELAKSRNSVQIVARHGGDVPNCYGYPAETEGIIVVTWPNGKVWAKVIRLPANKVTLAGVFAKVWGEHGLFDKRFSVRKRTWIRNEFISYIEPMATLNL